MMAVFYYGYDFLYTAVKVLVGGWLAAVVWEPAYRKWTEQIVILLTAVVIGA